MWEISRGKWKEEGSIKREHVRNKLVFKNKMVKGPAMCRREGIKGNKVKK